MASTSQSNRIRVALVGLNAPYTSTPTGTNWTARAHLPYLRASPKYEIVALQNSSAERAANAIAAYGLDAAKVKAYGSPEDVANDPNVDLVVTSIRVDRHGGSLIPAIKAKKDVFVEWPIEANYSIAKELTDLCKTHKVRNVVGLQGRFTPIIQKVKSLIEAGEIGRLESSSLVARQYGGPTVLSPVDYFTDRKVGGNPLVIAFGHTMECVEEILGTVTSHKSLLVNQYPLVSIVEPGTYRILEENRPNDVPNQIVFNAIMSSGAVFTYKLHNSATITPFAQPSQTGPKFPAMDWRIFGSKGELRILSDTTWSLNGDQLNFKLEICYADENVVKEVDIGTDDLENLPVPARNIARLYEAFADGQDADGQKNSWYPDFEYALKRHALIEEMYRDNGFAV